MAEELSLVIENPNEGNFLKEIKWNKESFVEVVAQIIEQYKGVAYTEGQMKEAKNDRAKLNNMKRAISERRIQIKNTIMIPYNKFEKEVSEVIALIQEPIDMIDIQVKEYEENLKIKKKTELKEYFNSEISDLKDILSFEQVFDQRYLNVSFSFTKAKSDIKQKIDRFMTNIRSIETLCQGRYLLSAKDVYIRTLDISKAFAEAKRLQELDKKAEEEEEEERLREEQEVERERLEIEKLEKEREKESNKINTDKANVEKEEPFVEVNKKITDNADSITSYENKSSFIDVPDTQVNNSKKEEKKIYKAPFVVYGTKEQIMMVKEFMVTNNIRFEKG
jgi:hypothetical protein